MADVRESFDLEGRISLEAGQLPGNMTAGELERSRTSRLEDVLIVLERNGHELQQRLDVRLSTLLPDGVDAQTHLTFPGHGSSFAISVDAARAEGAAIDARSMAALFPDAVSNEIGAYIGEQATHIGMWQPVVVASIKRPADAGVRAGTVGQSMGRGRVLVGLTFGLALVGAAIVVFGGI